MKSTILTVVGLLLVVIVAIGADFLLREPKALVGATPAGGTFTTARQYSVAGVNLAAPGSNATSSSVTNTTGQDLFITAIKVGCKGVGTSLTAYVGTGLASLQLSVATTAAANPVALGNTNLIGGGVLTIATSSVQEVIASSTVNSGSAATPGSGNQYNIWPAGTSVTFTTNATNTAVCTFGVDAFSS